ncbi:MAG: hypothetical protein OEU90_14535 [Gammaproteobacteria bacterium]|nr:hypothetical protein [Gammaproteobacteria bacterium]MDH3750431.1 hypothetical protein [Gammaproteobacteria bacterium]MDH3806671.1 hypothetical protein [Gammaproteobacteria bacterium]
MIRMILFTLLMIVASLTGASQTVKEFSGSANTTTPMFTVDSPWLLDWRLDGDYDSLVALDITLVEARTGRHVGRVLHTKYKGNGVKLFNDGGSYQLRVSSTFGRWRIKIQQITHEEAKLYTPRRNN